MNKLGVKAVISSKARWIVDQPSENEESNIQLPISNIVKNLLAKRGIYHTEEAEKFLSPKLEDLHDPFLFPDMKKAVERIELAIQKQERILIFGDYDADGVTSTALIVEALRQKNAIVDYYIPNRFTEGYGPNEEAFRQAKEANVSLIITVDTGIAAVHEAEIANELGIDLIITDHHEAQEKLPPAYAIIHPKLAETYPFDELAGVGVSFKLAHALLGELPTHLIELAAIGTVADLVPLLDENRIIVHYGLKTLTSTNRPGIQMLKELASISGSVTEEHIGFAIGPRLNAVGRLQDATLAVELLLEEDEDIARELAQEVQALNEERQQIVKTITKEAQEIIKEHEYQHDAVIVVAKEDWNTGVVGIVASRLVNIYHRPAIVLGIDAESGVAKGSARSIEAFNLFENCMEIRDLFVSFGGHSQAAGMTLTIENIDEVRNVLNQMAREKLTEEDFAPIVTIDMNVDISDLQLETIEEIEKLAPFGIGNPKPIFKLNKEIPSEIRQIGGDLNHLKMSFQKEGVLLDVIGFNFGEFFHQIASKSPVELVGELGINEWNGRKKMQLMLKDLQVSTWQLFDFRGSIHSVKQLTNSNTSSIVAVHFQEIKADDNWLYDYFNVIPASDVEAFADEHTDLLLYDLPNHLDELKQMLSFVSPRKIYAYFKLGQESTFSFIPKREQFKQFYAIIMKRQKVNIQDRLKIARTLGWSKEQIEFIIKVFLDLHFVTIENGFITLNPNPKKQDLADSITYQRKEQQILVERTLYYSSYDELKNWIDEHLVTSNVEEAYLHGL